MKPVSSPIKGGMTTMRPERVLFYSDLSHASDQAFALALDLTISQRSDRLYIVHVLHSPYRFRGDIIEPGLAMGLNPEIVNVAEQSLRDRYEPLMKGYKGASFHVLNGVAGVEILRFIRKHRVEQALLARSVAQKPLPNGASTLECMLLEHCPCAILFVAPGRRMPHLSAEPGLASAYRQRASKILDLGRYRALQGQRKGDQRMLR